MNGHTPSRLDLSIFLLLFFCTDYMGREQQRHNAPQYSQMCVVTQRKRDTAPTRSQSTVSLRALSSPFFFFFFPLFLPPFSPCCLFSDEAAPFTFYLSPAAAACALMFRLISSPCLTRVLCSHSSLILCAPSKRPSVEAGCPSLLLAAMAVPLSDPKPSTASSPRRLSHLGP